MTIVRLRIKKAKNLRVADLNGFSDPYVIIHVFENNKVVEKHKTSVIQKNLNPKWNETFELKKLNLNDDSSFIKLILNDKDFLKPDDALGNCTIHKEHFSAISEKETPFVLNVQGGTGKVYVSLQIDTSENVQKEWSHFHDPKKAENIVINFSTKQLKKISSTLSTSMKDITSNNKITTFFLNDDKTSEDELKLSNSKNWFKTQKEVFIKFINYALFMEIDVQKIPETFQDSKILTLFLDSLSNKKYVEKMIEKPTTRVDMIENADRLLSILKNDCNFKFLTAYPEDIVDGNVVVIMQIIWSMILKYHINKLEDEICEESIEIEEMVEWINLSLEKFDEKVTNIRTDLTSGRILVYLLHKFDPSLDLIEYLKKPELTRIKDCFDFAEEKYKIPQILTPEQLHSDFDFLSNLTYFSYLRNIDPDYQNLQSKPKLKQKSSFYVNQTTEDVIFLEFPKIQKVEEIIEKEEIIETDDEQKTSIDIYNGLKRRRRDSLIRKHQGDYLRIKSLEGANLLLNLSQDTKVLFSGVVTSLTDEKKDVIWVITSSKIYELDRNIGNAIKKTIEINDLKSIGFSPFKDGLFVVYSKDNNDLLYESMRKSEICEILSKNYQKLTGGGKLKIVVDKTIPFHPNPINFNIIVSNNPIYYIIFQEDVKSKFTTILHEKDGFLSIKIPIDQKEDNYAWEGSLKDEKESIYEGRKLRNRSSLNRKFIGDYMALENSNRLKKFLKKGSKLLFADRIQQIVFELITDTQVPKSKLPHITAILTESTFYLLEDKFDLKSTASFPLKDVKLIFMSSFNDNYFLLKTKHSGDLLFNSNKKTEIISIILEHSKSKIPMQISNKFEFTDSLKQTHTLTFSNNSNIREDLIHREKGEYTINISQNYANVILESAYLYQKGNSTPYDITTSFQQISLKPNVSYQTHLRLFSNVTLKGCKLIEQVDTVFYWNRTEYKIGNISPDLGVLLFIVPNRKAIGSFVSYVRVKYTLVDENGKEYLFVKIKYDGGKNLHVGDEVKDLFTVATKNK
eukprot:gene5834-9657_t